MNKDKTIEEVLGSLLFPLGYSLEKTEEEGWEDWCFKKQEGDLRKWLDCLDDGYRLILQGKTNAYGQSGFDLYELLKRHGVITDGEWWWTWESEGDWTQCIKEIRNGIAEFGLKELDRISVPTTEIRPKIEHYLFLETHYDELIKSGMKKWDLEGKVWQEQINILFEAISQIKGEFQDVENDLIEIAALIGDIWCKWLDGEWQWFNERPAFLVYDKYTHFLRGDIVHEVIVAWRSNNKLIKSNFIYNIKYLSEHEKPEWRKFYVERYIQ